MSSAVGRVFRTWMPLAGEELIGHLHSWCSRTDPDRPSGGVGCLFRCPRAGRSVWVAGSVGACSGPLAPSQTCRGRGCRWSRRGWLVDVTAVARGRHAAPLGRRANGGSSTGGRSPAPGRPGRNRRGAFLDAVDREHSAGSPDSECRDAVTGRGSTRGSAAGPDAGARPADGVWA